MMDKKGLRKALAARRGEVHGIVDPAPALAALAALLDGAEGPVSFYWPIRSELDPRAALAALSDAVTLCLPVTHGRGTGLTFRRWTPGAAMEIDSFGVGFPAADDPVTPRTLIVPLLGFDRRGHRLGYGAGHYDRTLEGLRAEGPVTAIGLAYAVQEIDEVPIFPTDQPLDVIVTEAGVIRPLAGGAGRA